MTGDDGDLGAARSVSRRRSRLHPAAVPRRGARDSRPSRRRAVAPIANPGLRGNLVDIGLGTLLSLFEFERKSGILLLLRGGEIARLFVSEGRMLKVEASAGQRRAASERLMALLDWEVGQFEFSPCAIGGRDEIERTDHADCCSSTRVHPTS